MISPWDRNPQNYGQMNQAERRERRASVSLVNFLNVQAYLESIDENLGWLNRLRYRDQPEPNNKRPERPNIAGGIKKKKTKKNYKKKKSKNT